MFLISPIYEKLLKGNVVSFYGVGGIGGRSLQDIQEDSDGEVLAPNPRLSLRARETRLDGADESGSAVGDRQERVGQSPALEVFEEGRAAGRVLCSRRGEGLCPER